MAGYVRDPAPAIPANLPMPIEEAPLGYAVRYPGRNQPWHWWCPDPSRPNVRVAIKCADRYVTGAEIAVFDRLLGKESRYCHRCQKEFQQFMVIVGTSAHSKLDEDMKKALRRFH